VKLRNAATSDPLLPNFLLAASTPAEQLAQVALPVPEAVPVALQRCVLSASV